MIQRLDNIELNYTEPTHSHTPSTSHFIPNSAQDNAEPEDPIADTLANESDVAFEPDKVDYPIPPEDGIQDVDINIVAENFAQGTTTFSQPVTPHRTTQQIFYRSILFFDQTFPEVSVDSIDVPNLRYAKFYDKNEGRLDVGILFKNGRKSTDEESHLSWKWFLRQLSRHIIRGRWGICLISDRHAGITRAVRECLDFVPPNGVHRYYLRHVCFNFNGKHKNIELKDLYWKAGSEYQKSNRIMEEIKS
ncbi:UNVERIFIED_CONTAM: hypothetical protein Sindi_0975100 [Sesamum indicum]